MLIHEHSKPGRRGAPQAPTTKADLSDIPQQLLRKDGMKVTWLEVDGPVDALVRKIPADSDGVVLLLPPGAPEMPVGQ